MPWLHLLSYAAGGAALTNAVPHLVSGVTGRAFPTPFAKPPGKGLSSSTTNLLWAFVNLVLGYLLVCRVGVFDLRTISDAVAFAVGGLLIGLMLARHFGQLQGGDGRA